jgi:NAD(P)-dependent dehydrogenase (short-subunit alcohol dehydrogenase family)
LGTVADKVVLVTGGSAGIGRVTALAFAKAGAKVVIAARRIPEGEETVSMITEAGGDAIFVQTDVSKPLEVEAMVRKIVEAYGRLDCAFNNAGVSGLGTLTHDYTEERWDEVTGINLKGTWLCMKYEIAQMLTQGGGSIVNDSSAAGLVAYPGGAPYAAAKHGIIGLTKSAAMEYAQQGIRINAVCPGYINTPMMERALRANPQLEAGIRAQEPMGRLGTSEEVAAAVVWLCSDAASFVTGIAMPLDGGLVAQSTNLAKILFA